jgi:putative nucleotidyltransferase with HDIG domain
VDDRALADDLIRRLSAAIRSRALYPDTHPLARQALDFLSTALDDVWRNGPSLTIGFLGDDVVVGTIRLKRTAALSSLSRHFREREVEKLTISRELGTDGLSTLVGVLAEHDASPVGDRLDRLGLRGCSVGLIPPDALNAGPIGVNTARSVYNVAVQTAESLWGAAHGGDEPDPDAAQRIIDSLASAVSQDRASMVALTSIKSHDAYTFSHMVNVSLLTMAQARTLGIQGSLLREFGLAGLMHDIGKVKTPPELLNKPGRLTDEETKIVRRHVVDGAQILRRTPNIPPLVAMAAFEHHLRQDLSGYPEHITPRPLNLCSMLVTISDVFDALRSNRAYRDGLPSSRVRAMLAAQSGTSFEPTLLRRFITLMGLFPIGTVVRLESGEVAVVTEEHATDPFRPRVRVVRDADGRPLPEPRVITTWERNDRGEHPYTVLEAVDAVSEDIDPLAVVGA